MCICSIYLLMLTNYFNFRIYKSSMWISCLLIFPSLRRLPDLLWAQRKPHVFLTIDVPNVTATTAVIELTEESLHFKGFGGIDQSEYEVSVNFYKPIDLEKSTKQIKARGVYFLLEKKEEEWWPKLSKDGKMRNHKVDWDNYKDEDDADEDEQVPADFDMSQFGGMGGMPGMEGMDFSQLGNMAGAGADLPEEDGDDEEIPNLEDKEEEEEKKEETA